MVWQASPSPAHFTGTKAPNRSASAYCPMMLSTAAATAADEERFVSVSSMPIGSAAAAAFEAATSAELIFTLCWLREPSSFTTTTERRGDANVATWELFASGASGFNSFWEFLVASLQA